MRKSSNRRAFAAILALTALAVLALAIPASAAKAPGAGLKAPAEGMQVAIDPATGKIRQPTAAESRALAAQGQAGKFADKSLAVTTFPDGTISAVLGEDYLNVWLVSLGANGSLNQVCVDGSNATQPIVPALEEK